MSKRKRARLRTAGGDRQGELFALGVTPGKPRKQPPPVAAFRWNDPDPRGVSIGNTKLETFLKEQGFTDVLVIREVLRAKDWTEFEKSYRVGGRLPYHPAAMVGLVLFGIMRGITSLRAIEQMGRSDVRCWWLTGGLMPDHSALGKFINKHAELLSGQIFEEFTRVIVQRLGARGGSVAIDGTVVRAAASRYNTLKAEAAKAHAQQAEQDAQRQPDDEALRNKAQLAKQVAEQAAERTANRTSKGRKNKEATVAPSEPDAVVQLTKDKALAPSYKPSVGANEHRIITGYELVASCETDAVDAIVEQHERTNGQPVEQAMMDAGYNSGPLLQRMCARNIDVLCPEGTGADADHWEKTSDKQLLKSRFRYDEAQDCYWCPAGRKLSYFDGWSGLRRYRSEDCGGCALRARCCKASGPRSIRRSDADDYKEALREVMRQPRARAQYQRRQSWVEPVFAELKGMQHLLRFARRGLAAVRLEFGLHCLAHNFRRLLALLAGAWDPLRPPLRRAYDAIWSVWMLTIALVALLFGRSTSRVRYDEFVVAPC
jgi:transposase